jgi:thioredoxin 1
MLIEKINQANFKEKVISSKIPVIINFYTDWHNPCRLLAPILEELALENIDRIAFYKVDTDENPNLIKKYKITKVPTLLFFKKGNLCFLKNEINNKLEIQKLIESTL